MYKVCIFALLLTLSAAAGAQPQFWQSEGPQVTEEEFFVELPIEYFASKIYVSVQISGEKRRFVFDTGSPSMIDASLASELGLLPVGVSKGIDAHGVVIESNVVQADFALGGVQFQKVPMFVADLSSETAQCLLGAGVLGSELLPLCAWQIDLPDSKLRCASNRERLDHVRGSSRQKLYGYGYLHTPFVDVQLAKGATSKAMFDTGSAPLFVISPPDLEGAEKARGIQKRYFGKGSSGTSLGGKAPDRRQQRVDLRQLAIGNLRLGRVNAMERKLAPSLIGASILDQFIVTVDSVAGAFYFDRYSRSSTQSSFGFALSFEGGTHVSLVWEDSPAAQAGMSAGQRILSLNGSPTGPSCDSIRGTFQHMQGDTVDVEWIGGTAKLSRR